MIERRFWLAAVVAVVGLSLSFVARGQEAALAPPIGQPKPTGTSDLPKGVEVLDKGPVHEAFASPDTEPQATTPVPKAPPKALDEIPPDEKPEGNALWISGYWAWDDARKDYLWVSGIWRTPPPDRHWVAGYWREDAGQYQWVPGFWDNLPEKAETHEVTYMPQPPQPPQVADPGRPPTEDGFWVPGHWVWNGEAYAWKAGYWARVQPGYVWVPAHYTWTPSGYVFVGGYWDLAFSRRGVMYAPVYVDEAIVGPGYVYTPCYVVPNAVVVDCMIVGPCYHHYYYGDYYAPCYRERGYECVVVYSHRHYDSIVVYERWDHRREPEWERSRVDIYVGRCEGRVPCPDRREMIVRHERMAEVNHIRTEHVEMATRMEAKQQAMNFRQVAAQRQLTEAHAGTAPPRTPMSASYSAVKAQPVAAGMRAQSVAPASAKPMQAAPPPRGTGSNAGPTPGGSAGVPPGSHPGIPPGGHGSTPPGGPSSVPPGGHAAGTPPGRPGMAPPVKPQPPAHQPPAKDPHKKDKDK